MRIVRLAESITLAIVALIAIAVAVLDLSGALDGVDWLRTRISLLTLLVAGATAGRLAVAQMRQRHDLTSAVHEGVADALKSTDHLKVRRFATRADYWNYVTVRILSAHSSIDDLTWGPVSGSSMSDGDLAAYARYRDAIKRVTTGRGDRQAVVYREIMSFPSAVRIDRAKPLMSARHPNFHLRYYSYDHASSPPMAQFYILDGLEVLITVPSSTSSMETIYYSFQSDELTSFLAQYFEIAWSGAKILKDVYGPRMDVFEELARQ